MFERPRCVNCGTDQLVTRLHRERGGPMVCPKCNDRILLEISRERKAQEAIFSAFGQDSLEVLGSNNGHPESQLSLELLDDILSLVHPDKHPPERASLAHRVTVELLAHRATVEVLALGQPVKSRPASANLPVTGMHRRTAKTSDNTLRKASQFSPCDDCRVMAPRYYCDDCRQRWARERQAKREKENAAARQRRARKRLLWRATCAHCETAFIPKRRDARYCSAACRQKAHRTRTIDLWSCLADLDIEP